MANLSIPDQRCGTARWRWLVAATIVSLLLAMLPVLVPVALAAGPFTVDTNADTVTANACATNIVGACSLREAIIEANAGGGATINLPANTYALTLTGSGNNGDLDITSNVTITGAGASTTIIDATALGDRVFDVSSAAVVSITGVTIRGGASGGTAQDGGGIRTAGTSSLTLDSVVVSGNTATGNGGGVFFGSSGVLVINNSTISGNSAITVGGGLALFSAANAMNRVTASAISGNHTAGGSLSSGGGVFVSGNVPIISTTSTLSLTNTTVSGNSTGGQPGGGISTGGLSGGATTLTNVTVASNSTGILRTSGTVTVSNSIVANSTAGANCSGTIVNGGYNVDSGQSCFGAAPSGGSLANSTPLLAPLAVNAPGTTATHALQSGSSAFNLVPSTGAGCPATDQRGVARPQSAAENCDSGAYELLPAPTISSVLPSSGPVGGGTPLTIAGTRFQSNAAVTVGGNPCMPVVVTGGTTINGSVIDGTQITCNTPPGTAGLVDVVVTNADGGTVTSGNAFEYLSVQGAQPSPSSVAFPDQQVNTTSAAQPVTLTNSGTTPLTVTAVAITGANASDFAIEMTDCVTTLAANGTCTVDVSFTPTAATLRGAALTFTDDSGGVSGSQQNVGLSGTGTAATVTFDPTSVPFGTQQVGTTSSAKNVTLTNNGTAPLVITAVALAGTNAGDFVLTNTGTGSCTGTIAIGASCTISVQFKPTASDLRVASIKVTDDANGTAGSVQSVPLSGGASPAFTVTASANTGGTIAPTGVTNYTAGAEASYTATPDSGQVFLGWTLDGVYVGYASPIAFTVNGNRVLVGKFAPRPSFTDVPTSDADYQAITFLAAFGIVNPDGVNGTHQFQPNRDVARAEMAAFIARVFGWDTQFHSNTFPDKCDQNGVNCVDNELWNDVAALQDFGVVGGYADQATCASAGTTASCYLPRDPVQRVQVLSIIARAFIKDPTLRPNAFWDRLDANLAQYTNVPNEGTQRSDLTTYRANAGPVPGQASDTTFPNPTGNGARRFVIEALYEAFAAQFGTDRVP